MNQPIRVSCLLDRYWDPAEFVYAGTATPGNLLDLSVQSKEADAGVEPVGIVQFDDGSFRAVPIQFITYIQQA